MKLLRRLLCLFGHDLETVSFDGHGSRIAYVRCRRCSTITDYTRTSRSGPMRREIGKEPKP